MWMMNYLKQNTIMPIMSGKSSEIHDLKMNHLERHLGTYRTYCMKKKYAEAENTRGKSKVSFGVDSEKALHLLQHILQALQAKHMKMDLKRMPVQSYLTQYCCSSSSFRGL